MPEVATAHLISLILPGISPLYNSTFSNFPPVVLKKQ